MTQEAMQNIDRDMDKVFDLLYIMNTVIPAIIRALPDNSAAQVMKILDKGIDGMREELNPPDDAAQMTLFAWRNMAATQGGGQIRQMTT